MKTAETGPKVNDDFAEIVNRLVQEGLSEEKLQDKQGVSYSQKFRVKGGFPNYLEVAISQFGSAKK